MDAVSKNQKTTKGFKMKIDYKFEYRGKWYNILRLEHEDFGVYFEAKAACQADFQKRRAR